MFGRPFRPPISSELGALWSPWLNRSIEWLQTEHYKWHGFTHWSLSIDIDGTTGRRVLGGTPSRLGHFFPLVLIRYVTSAQHQSGSLFRGSQVRRSSMGNVSENNKTNPAARTIRTGSKWLERGGCCTDATTMALWYRALGSDLHFKPSSSTYSNPELPEMIYLSVPGKTKPPFLVRSSPGIVMRWIGRWSTNFYRRSQ